MDSGNSGSLQSSSGGSEEYDSRVESISAFLNHSPLSHIGHDPLGNQTPPPVLQQPQSHSSSTMFDPSSYLDYHPLSRSLQLSATTGNPRSVLNLDAIWSKDLRSEPNCTDLSRYMTASSAALMTQQLFANQQAQSRATSPLLQVPQGPESSNQCSVSATNSQPNNKSKTVRNPKKRTRVSRRAATTVMITDTSNFRAMVQEFTGIPEPPFTFSPFPRARLDLFDPPSSTFRSTHFDPSPAPHYLLRPFSEKISPPPLLSSSMADAIVSNPRTNNNNNNRNTSSSSTSINYQLPFELGHLKKTQNLLNINMQNPILNFQPLLQTPQKYSLSGSNILGTKSRESLEFSLKMGALEEFGSSQGHADASLADLQNMVSSQEHDQNLLRSMNGKVSNLSSSPSDFHGDKGPEHVGSRSEGMVESWICSSD
ncbi:Succinate dehydrogenase 2-3 [Hibiscus syriacus]|uniref:Succinate dehydrogenase 2-3 n=1 Tax=Hibiscus syriacus TaxID=106335 RepID=A0A6A2YMZ7_HIBSY|nr:rhoGEF domain-containing protein gxcI-like [Hibiscus syriacus]KAE8680689.1 Succinate dehydrogenase 2-3 [Hibiscus syriacus]